MESTTNAVNSKSPIDWDSDESLLFLNPRMSEELQSHYHRVFTETVYRHKLEGHLGFLTSGTTVTNSRSYKMVFLSKKAFLAAAQGFNNHVFTLANDIWLQCLPRFHVGGIAIEARAHLRQFQVEKMLSAWDPHNFHSLLEMTKATWTSLVPTQVYDLVKAGLRGPSRLRVLIGGGRLSPILHKQAQALGWNMISSYGMTEFCSTVATIEHEHLKALPHVSLDIIGGQLAIKSESLFTAYAQVVKGHIELTHPLLSNGYFITEDSASMMKQGPMILGRSNDVVKISGELVSLAGLRDEWFAINGLELAQFFHIMAMPDERTENRIIMIIQKDDRVRDHSVITGFQPIEDIIKQLMRFQSNAMPFERIKNIFSIDEIPRTELGKVQERKILQLIEEGAIHEVRFDQK